MEKINWKQKLTSRKFWTAIASFVALLIVAMGGTQNQAAQITAIIMAGATVIAYIVGEGLVDAAAAQSGQGLPDETIVTPTETITVPGVTAGAQDKNGAAVSDTAGAK